MECCGEEASLEWGPELMTHSSSLRALGPRVVIEKAEGGLSSPTINPFMSLRLGSLFCEAFCPSMMPSPPSTGAQDKICAFSFNFPSVANLLRGTLAQRLWVWALAPDHLVLLLTVCTILDELMLTSCSTQLGWLWSNVDFFLILLVSQSWEFW